MLVVKVELWPFGSEADAKEIGRLKIHNTGDHEDRPRRGNYVAQLIRRGTTDRVTREARVEDYARLSYPVWKLIRRALEALDV